MFFKNWFLFSSNFKITRQQRSKRLSCRQANEVTLAFHLLSMLLCYSKKKSAIITQRFEQLRTRYAIFVFIDRMTPSINATIVCQRIRLCSKMNVFDLLLLLLIINKPERISLVMLKKFQIKFRNLKNTKQNEIDQNNWLVNLSFEYQAVVDAINFFDANVTSYLFFEKSIFLKKKWILYHVNNIDELLIFKKQINKFENKKKKKQD